MFYDDSLKNNKNIVVDLNKNNSHIVCDGCGFKYDDFLRKGLLSCSKCYLAFYDRLVPVIRSMQHDIVHKGKVLEVATGKVDGQLKNLELALKQAVAIEDYELASKMKKQIINLKLDIDGGAYEK